MPAASGILGMRRDRRLGRGEQSLKQLRELGSEVIEDIDPGLVDLDGYEPNSPRSVRVQQIGSGNSNRGAELGRALLLIWRRGSTSRRRRH